MMSQWGVSVAGFIRPRTAAVHSVTNQVWRLPLEDFGQAVAADGDALAVDRPWLGVTLTTTAGGAGRRRNGHRRRRRHGPGQGDCRLRDHRVHAEDLRTRFASPGDPGAPHHSTGHGCRFNAPPALVSGANCRRGPLG